MSGGGPKLRFCPESNDLLYPKEDKERKVLVYFCRRCGVSLRALGTQGFGGSAALPGCLF